MAEGTSVRNSEHKPKELTCGSAAVSAHAASWDLCAREAGNYHAAGFPQVGPRPPGPTQHARGAPSQRRAAAWGSAGGKQRLLAMAFNSPGTEILLPPDSISELTSQPSNTPFIPSRTLASTEKGSGGRAHSPAI